MYHLSVLSANSSDVFHLESYQDAEEDVLFERFSQLCRTHSMKNISEKIIKDCFEECYTYTKPIRVGELEIFIYWT